jgi:hypothetical protein
MFPTIAHPKFAPGLPISTTATFMASRGSNEGMADPPVDFGDCCRDCSRRNRCGANNPAEDWNSESGAEMAQ